MASSRLSTFVLVAALLGWMTAPARAMTIICLPVTAVVPENPSLVVSVDDARTFRATTSTRQSLPFTTQRLGDHFVWVTIRASHGTEFSVNHVEGPVCAQFQKLRVDRAYRPDRTAPALTAVSQGSLLGITLQRRPAGWMQMEWAFTRGDLMAGRGGVEISGFNQRKDGWYGVILPFDEPRPMYVRFSTLLPDRSVGGTWTGWIDRDGRFGTGLAKTFAQPFQAPACARGPAWDLPDGRFIVRGWGQPRYRLRVLSHAPVTVPLRYLDHGTFELAVHARSGTVFWLTESAGACHGPFRVASRRTRAPTVIPGQVAEYGEDVLKPEGVRLEIDTPTLWWKLRVEWSPVAWQHAVPATTRTEVRSSTDGMELAYDKDLARTVDPWFLRITPLFADGSEGRPWTGRLVRKPKQLELVAD